ncbi:sulfurtransferase TusA family protein [Verrucomicrobiota bacterium]
MAEIVDARGLSCPIPVIMARRALDAVASGEVQVLVDEEVAKENVSRLARSSGCPVDVVEEGGEFRLRIEKTG